MPMSRNKAFSIQVLQLTDALLVWLAFWIGWGMRDAVRIWLGMGVDGHTASIFPGPDLDEALNGPKERRALGVMPDPMPKDAPVARVTLSKAAILTARSLTIAITGAEKRAVLERAIAEGVGSNLPIGRVLGDSDLAVDIHWSA